MTDTNGAVQISERDALRKRKEERELAHKAELEALEVDALKLEEKYLDEGLTLGVDFAIVSTLVGNFVVKNPDFMVAKKFSDSDDKGVELVVQFVSPCIASPDTMTARTLLQSHAGIAWKLAGELLKLHEADIGKRSGK